MASLISALKRELATGRIISDPDLMESYRRDQAALVESGRPQAVVLASTVDDVVTVLQLANHRQVPVVPRGAGSGLSGGANAVESCIILDLSRMTAILDLSKSNLYARVEPGVINASLKQAASEAGLYYPPDPASSAFSTLGGNIATNAGGLCCVKYGVTRDFTMSLTVALADGTLMETGRPTRKSAAGYDLTSLMVGSEGTLGVIVEATMRLISPRNAATTVVATFPDLALTGSLASAVAKGGVTPSMLELLDNRTINAVENHHPMGLDRALGALVIAQSDSSDNADEARAIAEVAMACGAEETFISTDPAEAEMLIQARKLAYPSLERSSGAALLDDVCVPLDRVGAMVGEIANISTNHGIDIATFGHLGDGNLHPTILYDARSSIQTALASQAFDAIVHAALDLGGVITGEHGVGSLKAKFLTEQLGFAASLHNQIKDVFDPTRLLNPGKAVPIGLGSRANV